MSKFSYIFCDAVTNEEKLLGNGLSKFDEAAIIADEYNKSINRVDDMCDYIQEWEDNAANPKNVWQKFEGKWTEVVANYTMIF